MVQDGKGPMVRPFKTIINFQIRETTRNLWENRVQSAQKCCLLLQFNYSVMVYPLLRSNGDSAYQKAEVNA